MPHVFELLFGHQKSRLFTANLYAAWDERILGQPLIRQFAEMAIGYLPQTPGAPLGAAMTTVYRNQQLFQLVGPAIRPPRRNLINIRPLSDVHRVLMAQESWPDDRDIMLSEVRACILRRPEDVYGRTDRLLWLAEQDEEIEADINALLAGDGLQDSVKEKSLQRVMLFYGLPITSRTTYLITEFSFENWGSLPSDITYRRPTAFDAVEGKYFKQRRLRHCPTPNEWNKTADLASITSAAPRLGDGAWEAVGVPLQMARVRRTAIALSAVEKPPCDEDIYVEHVRQAYVLAGIDWDNIAVALAVTTSDGASDERPR